MIKRPKPSDTEEDLLSLQESFLVSGGAPSASVSSRVRTGEKREGRDVVQMELEGMWRARLVPRPVKGRTILLHCTIND